MGGIDMETIELEQIRPKECPTGKDNCIGCSHFWYVRIYPNDAVADCDYDESVNEKEL